MDRLLREISELRLSAATHLTIAAAAMDAGRPDIATDLIEAQQRDVASLRQRAEELLGVEGSDAEAARRSVLHDAVLEESALQGTAMSAATKSLRTPRPARSSSAARTLARQRRNDAQKAPRWSGAGAVLAIAATVAIALIRPLAPSAPKPPSVLDASAVASLDANVVRSYDQLQVTAKPKTPADDVEEAAQRLHADLQRLLPAAADDPAAARRLLDVLKAERALLADQHPSALRDFEPEAELIVARLRSIADPSVLAILPAPGDATGEPASAPSPAIEPRPAAAPGDSAAGSTGAGVSDSAPDGHGDAGAAVPAPAVVVPDQPADQSRPTAPEGGTGTDTGTGAADGGSSTGSASSAEDSTAPQLPAPPSLPAPPVVDPLTQ